MWDPLKVDYFMNAVNNLMHKMGISLQKMVIKSNINTYKWIAIK